jgi:hypothetical protein
MGKTIRNTTALFKRIFTSLYFLFFFNGFLLAVIFYCYTEDQYEKHIFISLGNYVYDKLGDKPYTDRDVLITSLHLTHELEANRQKIFSHDGGDDFKAEYLRPVSYDLMTAQGACGSYSYVLGRLLKNMNYTVRFVQMKSGSVYGAHNVIEAKMGNSWVVLDPLYDLYFTKPDGNMASFTDVQHNWDYYKQQLPAAYDMTYRYEGARYTNWSKIPVLMPAVKKVLDWTMGKDKADTLSLRSIFLRKFHIAQLLCSFIFFLVFTFTVYKFFRYNWKSVLSKLISPKPVIQQTPKMKVA